MTAPTATSAGRCFEWLERGATAVTATRRLMRHLTEQYARYQRDKGVGAWVTPDVLVWSAWLARAIRASDGEQPSVLLNDAQEQALWEQVIRDDLRRRPTDDVALWQHGPAARAARHARAAFHDWRMRDMSRDAIGDDAEAFLRWQKEFERRCRRRGCLDEAAVGAHLLERLRALRGRSPDLPETLIVAGFAARTPLHDAVFTALAARGVRIVTMAMPAVGDRTRRCRVKDPEDELHRAASWCRQKLFADADAAPPTLGVVVSDLDGDRRDQVARIFEQVLGGYDPAIDPVGAARLFHVSLGAPLSRYPAAAAALELLEWVGGAADFETFSRSVRSPFLKGAAEEWAARGRFDLALRNAMSAHVTPERLRAALRLPRIRACTPPGLGAMLRALLAVAPEETARQSPAAWSAAFGEWLAMAGWPGERVPDSHEYQTLGAWADALGGCASLSWLEGDCTARRAWALLMRIASRRVFTPEAAAAPVQVMGVEESAGLDFDALWVTGVSDAIWPPPSAPVPFLPVAEQRRLDMPGASWEASIRRAGDAIARLKAAAPDVIFSYAETHHDRATQASPLILDVRDATNDDPTGPIILHPETVGAARTTLEQAHDGSGPAPRGGARVHGGAALFRDQAACPFRAFAVHRLGSESVPAARVALTVVDHGLMAHAALESLWKVKDRRTQAWLTGGRLEDAVGATIDAALDRYQRENPGVMSPAARGLQRRRMRTALRRCLEFEAMRPPFTVVACEQSLERDFHGLRLRVRVDRIDEIVGGKHLLIDYKTGDARPGSWFGEHPKEPQLPLYRALFGERVEGVAFAKVRRGETAQSYLTGVCGEAVADAAVAGLVRVSACRAAAAHDIRDWPRLVAHWDAALERLAQAIAAGEAMVAPQPQACRYCDQHALCRIDERRAFAEYDGEDGDDRESDDA